MDRWVQSTIWGTWYCSSKSRTWKRWKRIHYWGEFGEIFSNISLTEIIQEQFLSAYSLLSNWHSNYGHVIMTMHYFTVKCQLNGNKSSGDVTQARSVTVQLQFDSFYAARCQHDDGYMDGRSQIKVHTDERTQVHSTRSYLTVTHPSTNRGQHCLTSVNVPLS